MSEEGLWHGGSVTCVFVCVNTHTHTHYPHGAEAGIEGAAVLLCK